MSEEIQTTYCGTVALVGRPNVGKSSLMNAVLGQKLAATTHKPQTTQRRFRGVYTDGPHQIVFVDTPGLHKPTKGLHGFMIEEALAAVKDVDSVIFVVEIAGLEKDKKSGDVQSPSVHPKDLEALSKVNASGTQKPILVLNKIDRLPHKKLLLPLIQDWAAQDLFSQIIPVSAHKKENLDQLLDAIKVDLPEGEMMFHPDAITDASEKTIAAELIREKAMLELAKELPYRIAVVVDDFDESRRDDRRKPLVHIDAVLNVERESQKGIVVGKGGQRIKAIGLRARKELERLLGCQVMLKLFVRVEKDWTTNEKSMRKLGYHT
jgi:GTP-binding protein Era